MTMMSGTVSDETPVCVHCPFTEDHGVNGHVTECGNEYSDHYGHILSNNHPMCVLGIKATKE